MKNFKNDYENLIGNTAKHFGNSDIEKMLYLHNFILSTVEYPNIRLFKMLDKKIPVTNLFDATQRNYFSIYGTLVNKKAHCFGIAKTYKTNFKWS